MMMVVVVVVVMMMMMMMMMISGILGGQLGLFLGVSLLTITELAEHLLYLLWSTIRHLLGNQSLRTNTSTG